MHAALLMMIATRRLVEICISFRQRLFDRHVHCPIAGRNLEQVRGLQTLSYILQLEVNTSGLHLEKDTQLLIHPQEPALRTADLILSRARSIDRLSANLFAGHLRPMFRRDFQPAPAGILDAVGPEQLPHHRIREAYFAGTNIHVQALGGKNNEGGLLCEICEHDSGGLRRARVVVRLQTHFVVLSKNSVALGSSGTGAGIHPVGGEPLSVSQASDREHREHQRGLLHRTHSVSLPHLLLHRERSFRLRASRVTRSLTLRNCLPKFDWRCASATPRCSNGVRSTKRCRGLTGASGTRSTFSGLRCNQGY